MACTEDRQPWNRRYLILEAWSVDKVVVLLQDSETLDQEAILETRINMKVSRCSSSGTRLAAVLLVSFCSRCLCSWVDPDTPKKARTTIPLVTSDKREYELVRED